MGCGIQAGCVESGSLHLNVVYFPALVTVTFHLWSNGNSGSSAFKLVFMYLKSVMNIWSHNGLQFYFSGKSQTKIFQLIYVN